MGHPGPRRDVLARRSQPAGAAREAAGADGSCRGSTLRRSLACGAQPSAGVSCRRPLPSPSLASWVEAGAPPRLLSSRP